MSKINKKDFSKRYLRSFVFIAIVLAIELGVRVIEINEQQKFGRLINISGKQRMLSQRALYKAHRLFNSSSEKDFLCLTSAIDEFKNSHFKLIGRNDSIQSLSESDIKRIYFSDKNLDKQVIQFIEYIDEIIKPETTQERKNEILQIMDNLNDSFLENLDEAVKKIEEIYQIEIRSMEALEYFLFFVLLGLIISQYFVQFRPLVERVVRNFDVLAEKEKELRGKNDALEEASIIQEGFLANLSHEIRTPINGIIGMTHSFNDTIDRKQAEENFRIIRSCAQTLTSLFEDAIELKILKKSEINIKIDTFNIHQEMMVLKEMLSPMAKEKGISIEFIFNSNIPQLVSGDVERIKQVLVYIITNAIKFTDLGKVSMEITKDKNSKSTYYFIIQDTGCGISPENISKIYDEYWQEKESFLETHGGMGVGLSLAQKIARALGGEIIVDSEVDVGSTFTFKIDLEEAEGDTGDKSTERNDLAESKVLLVEDNELNQKLTKVYLKKIGLSCDIAFNGKDALEKVDKEAYDLILMDIQMPVMNGIEATKAIIKQYGNNRPKIIALTANALSTDRSKYLEIGMDDVISKPINMKTFKEIILFHLTDN